MTLQEHDKMCNGLFRKLDELKALGQGGAVASDEYMQTLRELQTATKARLDAAGLGFVYPAGASLRVGR